MQVKHIDLVEGLHETPAHAPEGGVVEIRMVGNHTDQALTSLLNLPLGEAQELHVVILKPLGISLPQRFSV